MTEQQDKLVLDYLKFTYSVAYRYTDHYHRLKEDICSVAELALVEAAKDFDENKGIKFATYLAYLIKWKIYNFIRSERVLYYNHLETVLDLDVPDKHNDYDLITNKEYANYLLNKLDGKDRLVIEQYYYQGYDQPQIAKQMNVGRSNIGYFHIKALKRMKACSNISQ